MSFYMIPTELQPSFKLHALRYLDVILDAICVCKSTNPIKSSFHLSKTPCGVSPPPPVLDLCDLRRAFDMRFYLIASRIPPGHNMRDGVLKGWVGWLVVFLVILGHTFGVFRIIFGALGIIFGARGPHFWRLGDFRQPFRKKNHSRRCGSRSGEWFWEGFGGPKVIKKYVFVEHWLFLLKNMICWESCWHHHKSYHSEGPGSI